MCRKEVKKDNRLEVNNSLKSLQSISGYIKTKMFFCSESCFIAWVEKYAKSINKSA